MIPIFNHQRQIFESFLKFLQDIPIFLKYISPSFVMDIKRY